MSWTDSQGRRWAAAAVWPTLAGVALVAAVALAARPGDAPAAARQATCALAERPAAELSVRELRKSVVCLINKARRKRDLEPLSRSRKLQKAAQRHTKVIVETNCFAHRCPGEPNLETRLRRAGYFDGYRRWGYAESTGCAESAAAMVANWLDTRFHRMNLLGRKFREVGVGAAHGGPPQRCKRGFATFTAVFGWRRA